MAIDATAALSRVWVCASYCGCMGGARTNDRRRTTRLQPTPTQTTSKDPTPRTLALTAAQAFFLQKGVEAPERSYASLAYTICTATANLQLYRLYGYLSCGLRGKDLPAKATLGSSSRARSGAAGCA